MEDRQTDIERFHRDVLYYAAHQEELREQFAEQWVAIYNEQIVSVHPDFEQLLDAVEAKGAPLGSVYTHWVTKKPFILIV